ncbi:MAG: class I SAM-dependent methyltransferase [Candidatus Levybacteria bacterium]|nr:class I SAM-dependent methyltransferase [Candidatus Levybacteria bacterium]
MKITECRICESKNLKSIFSLGKQPLANNLLSSFDAPTQSYPLELVQCQHCTFIQLSYIAPKEAMFDNYFYIPSLSTTYLAHFKEITELLITQLNLKKNDFVVDIGGSDGSLLEFFKDRGMSVLNVEPAKNITSKVLKLNKYFGKETAREIVKKYGKAKLATATNVFAHIDDLHTFIEALDILLDDEGVFFAQFPDVRNLLKENQFDTIYHEHLSYFTYEPLYHLFANSPLEIFKIESSEIHGGSMRIYTRKRPKLLSHFIYNVKLIKKDLNGYLREQKLEGKTIAGFGAAAKGVVLLNYCDIDNKIIDFVADGTPYKQGKFIPGMLIPVKKEEELAKVTPDIVLILAWNFKEEIIAKVRGFYKGTGKKATFVVPIPKVEIIV